MLPVELNITKLFHFHLFLTDRTRPLLIPLFSRWRTFIHFINRRSRHRINPQIWFGRHHSQSYIISGQILLQPATKRFTQHRKLLLRLQVLLKQFQNLLYFEHSFNPISLRVGLTPRTFNRNVTDSVTFVDKMYRLKQCIISNLAELLDKCVHQFEHYFEVRCFG